MSLPRVAYFSMEMAIDQALQIYSGGLGFLSGSHMLSAGYLNLPMVGVTILWTNGYGKQQINKDDQVELVYESRDYSTLLKATGVTVDVTIFGEPVKVTAYKLEPEKYGTVPVYLLTTDIPENTDAHRRLTDVLYDGDQHIRVAQEIILGIGGFRILEAVGEAVDVVHINEGHALPVFFEMLDRYHGNLEEVRKRAVFTTHTPVASGNETHAVELLAEAGFFANVSMDTAIQLGGHDFSLTVAPLKMSRLANGVSQLHCEVANNMWNWVDNRCPIVGITNAVNRRYWQDKRIQDAKTDEMLLSAKKQMKKELFDYIQKETGKTFDPDVLTIVWARRFTQYKRPDLIFSDMERLNRLFAANKIQLLFAGKFHPSDTTGRDIFNRVIAEAKNNPKMAILTNYELELSRLLKRGSDVWLNTPLRPLEASGTSGMSANLNGTIHLSTHDGWAVEGTFDHINGYIINEEAGNAQMSVEERNREDYESMMSILEETLIPMYYNDSRAWCQVVRNAIHTAEGYFDSDRMVVEYYNKLYKPVYL